MSASLRFTRRGLIGGLPRWRFRAAPARKVLPGSTSAEGFAAVVPGALRLSGRSRPASGLSDRMVVPHRQSRMTPQGSRSACNGRCFARRWPGASRRLEQPAGLDGACRGDDRRHPSQRPNFCPRRCRPGRRRRLPVRAWIDLADARPRRMRCRARRPARGHGDGDRFQLCAETRRRPTVGAAGRRRLQPEIGPRPGVVLLQPALFRRPAASRSTTRRSTVTGRAWMDREWSSQPLASDQTGWDWLSLHLTGRQGDAVSACGRAMAATIRRQLDRHRRPLGASRRPTDIELTPTATTDIGGRKVPTSWRVAIPSRGLAIETAPLNPELLDGDPLSLLGRTDQPGRQPRRPWLS